MSKDVEQHFLFSLLFAAVGEQSRVQIGHSQEIDHEAQNPCPHFCTCHYLTGVDQVCDPYY